MGAGGHRGPIDSISIRSGRTIERGAGRRAAFSSSAMSPPNHFPWTTRLPAGAHAGSGKDPRQPGRGRRIYPTADDERATTMPISWRACGATSRDESFLVVRFRRSPAVDLDPDSRARARRSGDRAQDHGVRSAAISPPTTPIDAVNFHAGRRVVPRSIRSTRPICRCSSRRAAGLPLDDSFAEQKKILRALQRAGSIHAPAAPRCGA